jgi:hypothetical protein
MHSSFSPNRLLLIVFVLFIAGQSIAQNSWRDSLKTAFDNPEGIYATFHNRNKLFFGETIRLYGVLVGVNFDDKVRVFGGLYGFSNQDKVVYINSPRFQDDTVTRLSNTRNFSVGIEYTYKQYNKFSLTIPLMVGIGGLDYSYRNRTNLISYESHMFMPLEFGTNAYYDFLNWLGLKGGVGYRIALGNREAIRLTAPYYNFGIRFMPFKLYNQIKERRD